MHVWCIALLVSFLFASPPLLFAQDTIRLTSGKEVPIIDGRIPSKEATDLQIEAEGFFKRGRFDLASERWQLLRDRGQGSVVEQAIEGEKRIKEIEYGSRVHLGNGQILTGKVFAELRRHLLGLERKDRIPISSIEIIAADYQFGYSQVSKTFYPLTLLEIKIEGEELQNTRMPGEVDIVVENRDGSVKRAPLGVRYRLLKEDDLPNQIEELSKGRVIKLVVYPDLRFSK